MQRVTRVCQRQLSCLFVQKLHSIKHVYTVHLDLKYQITVHMDVFRE